MDCLSSLPNDKKKEIAERIDRFKHSGLVALMDTCELESGIEKETTEAVQI
jgi:hypothetical protein